MHHKLSIDAIEFLKNKVYLGSYDETPKNTSQLVYFTVEDALPYNAFHLDFGPLHIGHLYRFAVALHNILNDPKNSSKAVVFYSSNSPKARANAACLLCCYLILVQDWAPHQVLQPISQIEPPLMPFRDAGYSKADFELSIQDVVYGVWRAKERNMIDITNFNLEEYEQYERVDQGDFNLICDEFIAFASPRQSRPGAPLNQPFRKILQYFASHNVELVVRLNSHLYDKNEFERRGIKHLDMIFEDGSCPTMELVQKFIGASETIISNGGKIAVHCKAGLGRTGCLIGAYLIYTHGFTANECIGYMRIMRPGMVVGPQQHWLYLHQNEFRDWRHTMVLDTEPDKSIGGLFPLISLDLYKERKRQRRRMEPERDNTDMNDADITPDVSIDISSSNMRGRRKVSTQLRQAASEAIPSDNPGQPRKYIGRNGRYTNSDEERDNDDDDAPYTSTMGNNVISSSPRKSMAVFNENQENVVPADDGDSDVLMGDKDLKSSGHPPRKIINHSSPTKHHRYPPQFYRRTPTTTKTTTTIASSPPQTRFAKKNGVDSVMKGSKQRSNSARSTKSGRMLSSEGIIGNPGVRKLSSKHYES